MQEREKVQSKTWMAFYTSPAQTEDLNASSWASSCVWVRDWVSVSRSGTGLPKNFFGLGTRPLSGKRPPRCDMKFSYLFTFSCMGDNAWAIMDNSHVRVRQRIKNNQIRAKCYQKKYIYIINILRGHLFI